ncbi:excinuclease ABC subunit UvrC [Anaerosalibacter bizertensis]|uniref:UvrABC system protein C n=1 Tax=Anaerosalibacter bizertensis TaxID=932217 RepID=A0A844FF22_9FIRM|nr:excinuclease ABC subunit UvrC [Anaerosalibacter bizertensis]MBV1816541.1 excinuclease ABC subunit UvrC [Bacteroidales bacterium MSK.15.36]MCB5560478.1 excinuclease ABC subunit UvrC [Anaerosalibacter bizertensis]MCG4563928.1 excinuclease ABC subunit UvrC [Anaerosalibacter bizertensis]MCG4584775.1 excinuclease ABC subunit UvrC [Anaerosalibacter bizertensis]MSS42571.1 excinuclease ABC subunit UvrC [Anaerosalibacter bizertensis]
MFNIDEELKKLPDKPGVYIMKNETGEVIYVGKAISLKKRVRQYFQSSRNNTPKVRAMVKNISEFEYIIVDNEVEALILEANLIKRHRPKYNILLRDDKQYPYIKVTTNEKYPRVIKTRKILKDGAKYFGPYPNGYAVNDTLDIIRTLYPIRTCKLKLDGTKVINRPCLNYYIGRCLAPCQGNVDEDEYMKMIDEIIMFLNGREEKLVEVIEKKMENAAKDLDFENAAKYRDQVNSLKVILEKQKIVSTNSLVDQDIIGMARGVENVCIQVFFIRSGKIMGREHFFISDTEQTERAEILSSFIKQFYLGTAYVPKEIFVEEEIEDESIISKWLSEKRGSKVTIRVPKRGEKSKLMEMVRKNALDTLNQYGQNVIMEKKEREEPLEELATVMDLDEVPFRIEAFDISNIQGVEPVGSMVVFEKGIPKKSDYRRFKIRTVIGPNDYASMEEVIKRRFKRGLEEKELVKENNIKVKGFSIFPDLIMMDGGKGQVNIAERILFEMGIEIPVCGLVKDEHHNTRGIIYKNKEISLEKNTTTFRFITRIQDEAHRFAISYHRSLRNKKMFKSVLDDIKGIGTKRKKALLKAFGSVEGIKKASLDELIAVESMNKKAAEEVYNFFRK